MKKRLAKGRSSVVFVCLFMVVDVYGCCYCHCELLFFPTSPNSVLANFGTSRKEEEMSKNTRKKGAKHQQNEWEMFECLDTPLIFARQSF